MNKFILLFGLFVSLLYSNEYTDEQYFKDLNKIILDIKSSFPLKTGIYTLEKAEITDKRLRYTYTFRISNTDFDKYLKRHSDAENKLYIKGIDTQQQLANTNNACVDNFIMSLLVRGGTVEYMYNWEGIDEQTLSSVTIKDCESIREKQEDIEAYSDEELLQYIRRQQAKAPIRINNHSEIKKIVFKNNQLTNLIVINKKNLIVDMKKITSKTFSLLQIENIYKAYSEELKKRTINEMCRSKESLIIMRKGNKYKNIFRWNDGEKIATIEIVAKDCKN